MDEQHETLVLTISDISANQRERAIAALARMLPTPAEGAKVTRLQEDSAAMDGGASLVIGILSSGAGVAIARGIEKWFGRWQDAKVTMRDGKRTLIADRISRADVAKLYELFRDK